MSKGEWSVVGQNGTILKKFVTVPVDVVDKFDEDERFFYDLFADGSRYTLHELADKSRMYKDDIERIFHDEEWGLNRYIVKTGYRWGLRTEKVVEKVVKKEKKGMGALKQKQ